MNTIYFQCALMQDEKICFLYRKIFEWIKSKELSKIVRSFGGELPETNDISDLVKWLSEFSERWDYRKNQKNILDNKTKEAARWLVSSEYITNEQVKYVNEAITVLGLRGITRPMLSDYDYVVALGGARMSCLLRPQYASEILREFGLNSQAVVMLSGMRPISETEREATDTYAPGAATEYDLMNRGAELAFELGIGYQEERYDDENMNKSWAVRTYKGTEFSYPILSIAAPSSEPDKRRANSVDTFKFFFERYSVAQNAKILFITSEIYVPYQQLEAIRTLAIPYGVAVETIGFPNEWSGQMHGMREAGNYLQEIRSTIQAIERFINMYNERGLK